MHWFNSEVDSVPGGMTRTFNECELHWFILTVDDVHCVCCLIACHMHTHARMHTHMHAHTHTPQPVSAAARINHQAM